MNRLKPTLLAMACSTALIGQVYAGVPADSTGTGWASVAIGEEATADGDGAISIGYGTSGVAQGVSIGNAAQTTGEYGVALGMKAIASAGYSVALGQGSTANRDAGSYGTASEAVSFGKVDKTGQVWTSTLGAVSIGSDTDSRQITGVAAGSQDNDAVNVAQLKSLQQSSVFGSGASIQIPEDITNNVQARNANRASVLGDNAKVQVDNSVAIGANSVASMVGRTATVQFKPDGASDKAWEAEGLVSFGGSYESEAGATVNFNRQLTGVAAGSEDNDAVNVAQLKAVKAYGDDTYATQASLGDYLTTADASATYATQDSLGSYLTTEAAGNIYATQTTFSALDEKVSGLETTLNSMSGEAWDKVQETVTKLEDLEKGGLLNISASNAPQSSSKETATGQTMPKIQTVNSEAAEGQPEGNNASLGIGGKLNFVGDSNILASIGGDNDGNVTVKFDMAQDANLNSLTANSVTTETLRATKITAQDMELSGKLTVSEIVATTAIQAPAIQFTDGAALTYSKDSGRLTYTAPAVEGDGTKAVGETFSVATTKDGISFGADEGSSVLVNLEDQKVDIKGGDQYVTTSIVANADGGATVQIKMTDEFKSALGNGSFENGITIGAKDGYGEIRVQQGNVDMGGNRIQNVGNPIAAGDAVNKQYVDSTARSLRNKINDVDRDLRAGVAMAMAVGNLPQAYMPGKSIVGMSAGTYHGQGGFALGLSHATDNRQWVFKGAASVDTRGNFGGTLSAGYQF
ncbi:YadA family autotransporter adhesin [Parasutterella excrementihominis]|uniref:YadA family autotransporter adhesin n=1 Tax=Parasutterella excrementihominis TaxID=487175 RepID=UPI003AB1E70D